ncbi:hypothetical protein I552_9177 [Mycobacterium xenopi 3993]|nr:hypothetical protein I552_9177 [Mycobacterium xenopi 3993]
MNPGVVTDVHHGGEFVLGRAVIGGELAQAEQVLDTEQEAGAAHAADQNRDLHTARQYAR